MKHHSPIIETRSEPAVEARMEHHNPIVETRHENRAPIVDRTEMPIAMGRRGMKHHNPIHEARDLIQDFGESAKRMEHHNPIHEERSVEERTNRPFKPHHPDARSEHDLKDKRTDRFFKPTHPEDKRSIEERTNRPFQPHHPDSRSEHQAKDKRTDRFFHPTHSDAKRSVEERTNRPFKPHQPDARSSDETVDARDLETRMEHHNPIVENRDLEGRSDPSLHTPDMHLSTTSSHSYTSFAASTSDDDTSSSADSGISGFVSLDDETSATEADSGGSFVSFASSDTTASPAAARWGQQAVYVASTQQVWFVGGAVSSNSSEISNDVSVLDLTIDSPEFTAGASSGLGPTAFHTLTITDATDSSEQILVIGGMTSSCSDNPVIYSLDVGAGDTTWEGDNVAMVRRRALGSMWLPKVNKTKRSEVSGAEALSKRSTSAGEVIVVGGMADGYVCSSGTYAYPAYDILDMPMTADSYDTTDTISFAQPGNPTLAVADFSLTRMANTSVILAGGHDVGGNLMDFSQVGMYTGGQGWMLMPTSGDVPTGRVGHSMVAHPTLDVLIMFGGSSNDNGTVTPTTEVALLNTTSWAWSSPSAIQPSSFAGRAWHSSVMTPGGVMVSAFGMGTGAEVLSDVGYLDARSSDVSSWAWSSSWNHTWLDVASSSGLSSSEKKTIEATVPSVTIFLILAIPALIWFARRRVKENRRRALARHFEMHDEDDNLRSTQNGSTFGNFTNPLSQFLGNMGGRRRSSSFSSPGAGGSFGQFRPFGGVRMRDPEDRERRGSGAGVVESLISVANSIQSKITGKPVDRFSGNGREMRQVGGRSATAGEGDATQWEEIDFGLGKVDERKGSATPKGVHFSRSTTPVPQVPRSSTPRLVVVPPTQQSGSIAPESPIKEISYPVLQPQGSSTAAPADMSGWDNLAESVASKSLFKSDDSQGVPLTRSTSAGAVTPAPILPPLDFGKRMPSTMNASTSFSGAKLMGESSTPMFKRMSDQGMPGVGLRSASSPMSTGRDLLNQGSGSGGRNSISEKITNLARSVSNSARRASASNYTPAFTPAPAALSSPTTSQGSRLSNPPPFPPPTSPLPNPSASAAQDPFADPRPSGEFGVAGPNANRDGTVTKDLTMNKRSSGDSQLRVVNVTPDMNATQKESFEGQAL